jgi:glycerol-3-phosphate dehydrogenase (NAD(P)+)
MLLEALPQVTAGDVCVLSGPNLAGEIQRGLPAATVIAGANNENVGRAQQLFHSGAFRVYASDDVVGVELGGSLKNVIALAAGIADGLALGDNAKAGIITRGLAEMTRLGVAAGADAATFAGLAGTGDAIATCYSPLSRNRRCGEAIGRGASVAEAIASAGGVVEGIEATAAACTLAERYGVDMPIAEGLRAVLFDGAPPLRAIANLLERQPTREEP